MSVSNIVFQHVTKSFGDLVVFQDDSFELGRGLTFLVGRNGAGKSTLIRLATGIERPESGRIRVLDDSTTSLTQKTKRRLGVQLQNDAFLKSVRVREYVELYKRMYLTDGADSSIDLDEIAEMLDIGSLMRSYAYALSGGQKKRVSLFLAIVGRKDLLILDEPTAGIDVDVKDKIMRVIRLLQRRKIDLLVSSHDLGEFFEVADNVLVVDRGIKFNDTKSQFLNTFGYSHKVTVDQVQTGVSLPMVEHEDGVSYFARAPEPLEVTFPEEHVVSTNTKDYYQLATRATNLEMQ